MAAATARPVASATQKGTAFLQIVDFDRGVRVEPTRAGKTALPRYWPEWLWWNLLNRTDTKHGFAVGLHEPNSVIVQSNTTAEGLTETVRAFASEIRPVHSLSSVMTLLSSHGGITNWHVYRDRVDDVRDCLPRLKLPGKAQVSLRGGWLLTLKRDRHDQLPLRNHARMVEHWVAKSLWDI